MFAVHFTSLLDSTLKKNVDLHLDIWISKFHTNNVKYYDLSLRVNLVAYRSRFNNSILLVYEFTGHRVRLL